MLFTVKNVFFSIYISVHIAFLLAVKSHFTNQVRLNSRNLVQLSNIRIF